MKKLHQKAVFLKWVSKNAKLRLNELYDIQNIPAIAL